MGSPSPTQEEEVPGSPGDQVLRDLASDQWPSQVVEDQLLGALQLAQELSDRSSSGDENGNGQEGLLVDLSDSEEEEEVQEIMVPPWEEEEPMPPAPAPQGGSPPPSPSTPAPLWAEIMDQEMEE